MTHTQHDQKPHILFVCQTNKWRSPTAERVYRNDERIEVRSAGISEKSPHQVSEADVQWADMILVMEADQKSWLFDKYRRLALPTIANLDIPDQYRYMDEELIELIRAGVESQLIKLEG